MQSKKEMSLITIIFNWLLAFLMMGGIYVLSSQGADDSARLSTSVLNISALFVNYWQITAFLIFLSLSFIIGIWVFRRTKSLKKHLLFFIVYAILCLLAILFIYFIFRPYYLSSGIHAYNYWTVHLFFRKYAHFFVYLFLGFFVQNALFYSGIRGIKSVLIALIICMLYAVFDEIHQYFVPGRTALVVDVFIDTIGSFIGILVYGALNFISGERTIWQAYWNL